MSEIVLDINNLRVYFDTPEGIVKAVDGIDLEIKKGEKLALVGESGCGKSVTAKSILKLLRVPPALISADKMIFLDKNLIEISNKEMTSIRGKEISMIFQEPMTSLNPVYSIKMQLSEMYKIHTNLSKKEIENRCIEILDKVGIPDSKSKLESYPHNLSGGLRQRVIIAMALAIKPKLVIADEPTTALDVTIQAQILQLLRDLTTEMGMSTLLITHDFGVVSEMADKVAVMYSGKIVEEAKIDDIFEKPLHPYTNALIGSIPGLVTKRGDKLKTIKGMVPNPLKLPLGCNFASRCEYAKDKCLRIEPKIEVMGNRKVACHFWREIYE